MSVFKTTFSRALKIIPSDDCVIPSPNLLISGTATGQGTNLLIDELAIFLETTTGGVRYFVNTGDVVYNYPANAAATVVEVIDEHTLLLNADGIVLENQAYLIYQQGAQTGIGNQGCFIYSNATGFASGLTLGGDLISLYVEQGTFCPVQFISLDLRSSGSLTALW